jgi:hypothetical protein
MALTKLLVKEIQGFSGKVLCQNAYCRVTRINGNKSILSVSVEITNPAEAVVLETLFYEFAPDLNGPNLFKQAYLHLKTLPEFSDAVDC